MMLMFFFLITLLDTRACDTDCREDVGVDLPEHEAQVGPVKETPALRGGADAPHRDYQPYSPHARYQYQEVAV